MADGPNVIPSGPPYLYDDFVLGRIFRHHWGRTLTEADAIVFATQTHLYQPMHFNVEFARHNGMAGIPVSEPLVFATVLGLSVEDLSESGGPFLGADKIEFLASVWPGDTLYAVSAVVDRRESTSRPGWGVVRWRTVGINQEGEPIVDYERSSLVRRERVPTEQTGRQEGPRS